MALLFVARQTGAVTAAIASEWKETMALSKKPITGMKDILPEEMEIRDYVISVIKETLEALDLLPWKRRRWSIWKI